MVLDASAVLDLLLNLEPRASVVRQRVSEFPSASYAPHLIDAEVAQTVRRYVLRDEISPELANDILNDLENLPIRRVPHGPLLHRVLELRDNVTAYDGLYLVLAETIGATLLTSDAALVTVPGHHAEVELTFEPQ